MSTKKSIAYNMTKTVVLLTLLIGLVLGIVQVAWDYQQRLTNLNSHVEEVLNSIEKTAVKAVYTFDADLAAEVASGLFEFPPITSVIIKDENNKRMTSLFRYPSELPFQVISKFLFKERYIFNVPLKLKNNADQSIGMLRIEVSPHEAVQAFYSRSLTILTAAIFESFIISTLLLFVFYKRVTRPLHLLAHDFKNINSEAPEKSSLSLDQSLISTEFEEVTNAGNKMLHVIGSQLRAKDQAEAELKRQKNETERYLKIAEAIILQLDKNGKILMINQRGLDVMGYALHEVLGQDWFDLAIENDEKIDIKKIFSDLFHTPTSKKTFSPSSYYENEILTKKGKVRRIFWHNSLEVDRFGEAVGVLCSGQDVTARKEAEEALRATEGSLRAIIEATSEGFAITDLVSAELIDINSSFHRMLGYSREEMIFHPFEDFINPNDIDILKSNMMNTNTYPHRSFELQMQRRDGSNVPVEINASNLPCSQNENQKSVAFITNITERKEQEESQKRLETQLRQAQKMETIGTLAGGIAHDFNNILTPILGYSSILSSRISEDDPNHARIQQIVKSANRAATMVKQILTFSRRSEGEMISTYLPPVLTEAMELIRTTTPSNIEVKQFIPNNCPAAIADSTQIQQLVLNLCTNAAHAMAKDGGTLEVRLSEKNISEKLAQTSPMLRVAPYLVITVSDTGHGMDEEVQNRIFDPFYTTKKSGEGTGLGLAMVHGIVQNHNGDIFVESTPNKGTTFTIYIPVSETPVIFNDDVSNFTTGNNELALVIDDEALNINFLNELLAEVGYQSECYGDSIDALDAFMQNPDKYQIILTDQTMPRLTGDQLVKAIREIRPNIPIIMMSGYDQTVSIGNAEKFGVDIYLQKPISINALTGAMNDLLKDSTASH